MLNGEKSGEGGTSQIEAGDTAHFAAGGRVPHVMLEDSWAVGEMH